MAIRLGGNTRGEGWVPGGWIHHLCHDQILKKGYDKKGVGWRASVWGAWKVK